jgi:hypothetical protein
LWFSPGHRSAADVDRFIAAINAESFASGKVECAEKECTDHPSPPFDAPQVMAIIKCYSYSSDARKVLDLFVGPKIVYPMSCVEINGILDQFDHSSDKIEVLPSLKPFIHDAQNKLEIVSHFSFSSDKEKAEEILRDCVVDFAPPVPPEAAIQAALRKVGKCPAGYAWRQVSGGWRCAAGGHHVSDAALAAAM